MGIFLATLKKLTNPQYFREMMRFGGEMLVGLEKEPHCLVPECCRISKSQGKLSGYLLGAQNGRGR